MPSVRVGLLQANKVISKLSKKGGPHLCSTPQTRLLLIDKAWIADPWSAPPFIDPLSQMLHDELHSDYKKLENLLHKALLAHEQASNSTPVMPSARKINALADYMNLLTSCCYHGTTLSNIAQRDQLWAKNVSTRQDEDRIKQVLEYLEDSTNLCPNVDFKCLQVDPGMGDPGSKVERAWANDVSISAVEQTLDRVIALAESQELRRGDVIVYPAAYRLEAGRPDVPLIHLREISARIHRLTNQYKIIVVIPSGNVPGITEVARPGETGWAFDGYFNAGSSCGATIVDNGVGGKFTYENIGAHRCVDAYLNLYPSKLRALTTHDCKNHGKEQIRRTRADNIACKLHGTSGGAMAIACVLATVQEARRLRDLRPLEPYEARAHLRQWKVPSRSIPRSVCAPDVLGWLIGTGVLRVGPIGPEECKLAGIEGEFEIHRDDVEEMFRI